MTDEKIKIVEDIYRILFVLNNNMSKAIEQIKNEVPACEERDQVLQFIAESDKGIVRGPM
jgi:UDP-N-acetylglucosamine acyltransferase